MRRRLPVVCGAAAVAVSVAFAGLDAQAEWRVKPRISTSVSYTDNVDLDAAVSRSDVVTRVNPGISIYGESARTRVNIDYTGSFIWFVDEDREEWRNELFSQFHFEPVRDYFTIDARASISQPIVDETSAVSFSNANFSDNRRETIAVSAVPKLRHRLGRIADVTWSYTFRFVTVEDPADPDATVISDYYNHVAAVRIDSGNRYGRLQWDIDAFYDLTDRRDGRRNGEEIRVRLNGEYRVTRWLGVLGSVGWERIDLNGVAGAIDDVTWNAGFRFNPTRNTDVSVRYGHQSGDENFNVRAEHRRKRFRFFAEYDEDITTSQRRFANVFEDGSFNDDGVFVGGLGDPLDPDRAIFGFSNEAFRSKRFETGAYYKHRLTNAYVSGFYERRTFDLSDEVIREWGTRFRVKREFSPRASGNVHFEYRRTDFQVGPGRTDDFYGVRTSFDYNFSRYLTGVLSYVYSRRDSNVNINDLTENVVTISLRANL